MDWKGAILRAFGRKTEKVVVGYQCQEGTAPANRYNVSGTSAEIWVYGTTGCSPTLIADAHGASCRFR